MGKQPAVTALMAKFQSRENAYDQLTQAIYAQDPEEYANNDLVGTVFYYPDTDRYQFVAFDSPEYASKLRKAYPNGKFAQSKKTKRRNLSGATSFE